MQKNANIRVLGRGMYRPWRSPATWCLGGGSPWGFAALRMIIGFGTVFFCCRIFFGNNYHWKELFSCRIFFEKQLLVAEICDYQDELLQRFRRKNIRGMVFVGVMCAFIMLQPSIVLTYVQTTHIQKILYNHPGKN